ncbi:MAG: hypothetical protein V4577_26735 [Bacteroidota bacterium]
MDLIKSYEEIFPTVDDDVFIDDIRTPLEYKQYLKHASADEFYTLYN